MSSETQTDRSRQPTSAKLSGESPGEGPLSVRGTQTARPTRWRLGAALVVLSLVLAVCTAASRGWAQTVGAYLGNNLGIYNGQPWLDCSNPSKEFCVNSEVYSVSNVVYLGSVGDCTGTTQTSTINNIVPPGHIQVSLWDTPGSPSTLLCSNYGDWPGPITCQSSTSALKPGTLTCASVTFTADGWGKN